MMWRNVAQTGYLSDRNRQRDSVSLILFSGDENESERGGYVHPVCFSITGFIRLGSNI